jgi:hypothetical protein
MNFGTRGCMYCEGECNKECLLQEEPKAERMYSEDDIISALHSVDLKDNRNYSKIYVGMKEWFDQFKKK